MTKLNVIADVRLFLSHYLIRNFITIYLSLENNS